MGQQDILTFTLPETRFLSNFYPYKNRKGDKYPYSVRVCYNGIEFDCVENAYQAAKLTNSKDMLALSQMTPFASKSLMDSGAFVVRDDWMGVRLHIMRDLVVQKFVNSPDLARMLVATGNAQLIEGNNWGDVFWGVCNGRGLNHLGCILMDVRGMLVR